MINWHLYPYTDLHEMNLDWIIDVVKELDQRVDDIVEEITQEVVDLAVIQCKEYIDEQMQIVLQDMADLKQTVEDLSHDVGSFSQQLIDLAGDLDDLEQDMINRFNSVYGYIDGQIVAVNARTDAAIVANNDYIINNMTQYLANIKVLNFFTGEYVSIQDMFDYLCMFHVNDGIDYDTMNTRALTYNQFNALNIDYTNLTIHGNTLYV